MIAPEKISKADYGDLVNFRFARQDEGYLLTNDVGGWLFLSEEEFETLVGEGLPDDGDLRNKLSEAGFVATRRGATAEYAEKYRDLNRSILQGPSLFIFVVTLQCNHRCLYCQATPEKKGTPGFDMDKATAKKSVDLMFRAPGKDVGLEFQGGEPLLNWPIVQHIIRYAKTLNKTEKKNLRISMVTNLTLLDDEKLAYLMKEEVSLSCSLDGPDYVHDRNRIYLDGKNGSHKPLVTNLRKVRKAIAEKRAKYPKKFVDTVNAILTVTKFSLPYSKEIVDEYRRLKFDNVFIRPLSPFGLQRQTLDVIGYSAEEFIPFYEAAMDHILELNLKGERFVERTAAIALKKILAKTDPGYYEMRSPCGAGIGQMAFNYDGSIYTCDEGRMASRMGSEAFRIGEAGESGYRDVVDNEVTRTMCLASSLDNHAGCDDCVYKPYCGICPLANYMEYGTIFPQILNTDRHKINKALFDYLFRKLRDPKYREIFEDWVR